MDKESNLGCDGCERRLAGKVTPRERDEILAL